MQKNVSKNLLMKMLNNYFNYNDNIIPMYPWSNENLDELFKYIDVKDKNVLSVMASADQPLLCYLNGSKKVDTFDRNYCTLYHFYLRKWIILYTNRRNLNNISDNMINKVLNFVEPQNDIEKSALIFWRMLYNSNFRDNIDELDPKIFDIPLRVNDYLLPYSKRLKEEISDINFDFYNFDIFKNIDIEGEYDIIILSNILECTSSIEQLKNARRNILRLLKLDGIAVCSYKKNSIKSKNHIKEKDILSTKYYSHYLKAEEFGIKTNDEYGWNDLGYQYKKCKIKESI